MQLYLFQILTHRYLHLHLPLMHVFHINIYMYIYDMCYVYIILYSYLYVHMHKKTCLSHKIYPGKTSPGPLFYSPAQVGTAPAAHGALQAMDPKRSWQCTWRCGKKNV